MMGPLEAIGSVYSRYFQFSGRACAAEYWWNWLFTILAYAGLIYVDFLLLDPVVLIDPTQIDPFSFFTVYFAILSCIPYLAVTVRRLHDGGFSGFWILLSFVPALCGIAIGISQFAGQFIDTEALTMLISAVSMSASLALFVMLVWPSQAEDNAHGAPWRPGGTTLRVNEKGQIAEHDPMQGYALLMANEREVPPEVKQAREDARKEEVRRLYQERVLGRAAS